MKKLIAASGLALGLAGFGLFGGVGHALADSSKYEDSGTYDEMVEVHGDAGVTSIADDDGIQGSDNVISSALWVPNTMTGQGG